MEKLNIGYIRVSTREQAKEGYSLSAQSKAIENYYGCMMEVEKFKIFADEGYSAKSDNRPKYKKLIELIKEDRVGSILVYKVDRISRNLMDFNELVNLCIEKEIEFISIQDGVNFNTAICRGLDNIIMTFAQMEREQISERTNFGMQEALKKGVYAIGGILPLGIEKTEDKKIRYNEDIVIVKKIFELDRLGYSYCTISKKVKGIYNIKLDQNSIYQIIKNTIYRGYRIFNGKKYYLIEPIVLEKDNEETKSRGTRIEVIDRKRNFKKNDYKFERFLKEKFYLSTTRKRLNSGVVKEYKYYINKVDKTIKINEDILIAKLERVFSSTKDKYKNNINLYKERVQKMYINNIITFEELEKHMSELKKDIKEYSIFESIREIKIDRNKKVKVYLEKETLKFSI